jgi:Arc/MetJ-type ribon-helix-helix transcriptional regulator
LPPELDQRIQSQLALGLYKTPAEVLNDALDALDQRNEDLASIQRGIDDGNAGRLTSLHDFDQETVAEQVMRSDRNVLKKLAE